MVFEAEAGPLSGLKLIGFAVWERRDGGRNVTFPARQYSVNGERRSFALLRPANGDVAAQDAIRQCILDAYTRAEAARLTVRSRPPQAVGLRPRPEGPLSQTGNDSRSSARACTRTVPWTRVTRFPERAATSVSGFHAIAGTDPAPGLTVTAVYKLSEEGRKASLLAGGTARPCSASPCTCPPTACIWSPSTEPASRA